MMEPTTADLIAAAFDVCDRWEHDGVDDGKMGEDIARLRRVAVRLVEHGADAR